jgi:hypothetical protein
MTIPIAAVSRHLALPQPGYLEAPGPFAFGKRCVDCTGGVG